MHEAPGLLLPQDVTCTPVEKTQHCLCQTLSYGKNSTKLLQAVADYCAGLIDQYAFIEENLYHKTYLPNN